MNKKDNNICNILKLTLIVLVILCSIFRYKFIYIEPNEILEASVSNLFYPFTFLLILILRNKTNFEEAHRIVLITCLVFIFYNILLSIFNSIPGIYDSTEVDLALKHVFTPSYFTINKYAIYYPNILNTLSFTLLFYFSHTIILILYDAMKSYTKEFIAYSLSMFIPYTLDVIFFIIINDITKEIEFNKMIIDLSSNFVIVIITTIISSIIYSIIKVRSRKELKA